MDDATAEQVRELRHQGRRRLARLHHGRLPQDVRDSCREGVEFTEEPTERPYGIDCGLRDPFGNHLRITEPPAVEPTEAELRDAFAS